MPRGLVVYQFPVSHFCEKTRWNLDAKGLSYRVRDLVPGVHVLLARRYGVPQGVPILVDSGRAIADSSAIALHLERAHATPALIPTDEDSREKVLAIEAHFDEHVGPAVRRYMYGMLMKTPGRAARAMFAFYRWPTRVLGRAAAPRIEAILRSMYRINRETIERSRVTILEGIDRIEALTERDPSRRLVGDRLTLADITAASLSAVVLGPSESPWASIDGLPPEAEELRAQVRERPGGQWILRRYREDRHRVVP